MHNKTAPPYRAGLCDPIYGGLGESGEEGTKSNPYINPAYGLFFIDLCPQ